MAVPETTVEVEFTSVVVGVPLTVDIQTSGVRAEAYVLYGDLKLLAVQDVDYLLEFAVDLLSFEITPLQPLLDKIAVSGVGTNVIFAGRDLVLTSDFDFDNAFVREKLVNEFDRVWMAIQGAEFLFQDTIDYTSSIDDALAAAAAAEAAAIAAAASAASLTSATNTEMLQGVATGPKASPDNVAALWEAGANVVAAIATVLGEGGYFVITGNTGIMGITFATPKAGRKAWLYFTGTPLLTHTPGVFLIPAGLNYQVAAGDKALLIHDGGTQYRLLTIVRNSGKPIVPNTAAEVPFTPAGGLAATDVQAALAELDTEKYPASGIVTGKYTPTLTNGANVAASVAYSASYTRVDNMVKIDGRVDIDPTAAGPTLSVLEISLPFASNFVSNTNCYGTANWLAVDQVGIVQASVANDRAELNFMAVSAANAAAWYSFTYEVLP